LFIVLFVPLQLSWKILLTRFLIARIAESQVVDIVALKVIIQCLVKVLLLIIKLIPEYQAENKLSAKHEVEEAMTNALVRKCNNCGKSFLKEDGCNKMRCACGHQQCFVCSVDVVDYSHFDNGACPLYGDMADLLRQEVATAQETTVQQLLQKRADLEDEDVRVDKAMNVEIDQPSTADTLNPFQRGIPQNILVAPVAPFEDAVQWFQEDEPQLLDLGDIPEAPPWLPAPRAPPLPPQIPAANAPVNLPDPAWERILANPREHLPDYRALEDSGRPVPNLRTLLRHVNRLPDIQQAPQWEDESDIAEPKNYDFGPRENIPTPTRGAATVERPGRKLSRRQSQTERAENSRARPFGTLFPKVTPRHLNRVAPRVTKVSLSVIPLFENLTLLAGRWNELS
jgi:hypothetical protein